MTPDALHRAWVARANADADCGVLECRMCRRSGSLDEAITHWRNGTLVFAVCDRSAQLNDIVIRTTNDGIEVRGRSRGPIVIRGGL